VVNIGAVTSEALAKSDLLWVRTPEQDRLCWFAVAGAEHPLPAGTVIVVSGGGEQELGRLPEVVHLVLRSKGDRRRLLVLQARAEAVTADDSRWDDAADLALAERLNASAGTATAWQEGATIWLLTPFGQPVEAPGGEVTTELVAAPVRPAPATTRVRRPWHLGGRAGRRR
jgi:hypothetical protein